MATQLAVFIPGQTSNGTLATVTASSQILVGQNRLFEINADQDIYITFGQKDNVATPDASSYRIPANTIKQFDLGDSYGAAGAFRLYNKSGSTMNYFVLFLSRS
jgi:hypothetical protein